MRLYKRGETWWLDTTIDDERHRLSLDTTDWREARTAANKKVIEIMEGKVTPVRTSFAKLKFEEAVAQFLSDRKLEAQPSSYNREKYATNQLTEFFKGKRLKDIDVGQVQAYRKHRAGKGCGNSTINKEVGILLRLLKKAGLRHRIGDDIKPLQEPHTIGRALSEEEIMRLRIAAAKQPEWQTAFDAFILAINTGMRGADIKALRWCDIDFFNQSLSVPKSKTQAGLRTIPLTSEALKCLLDRKDRAALFGEVLPGHYVFPAHRVTAKLTRDKKSLGIEYTHINPDQPIGSWRTAWRALTKEAKLKGERFHNLRHTVITKLLESGQPDWVIMAIVGHVDRRMRISS